MRAIFIHFPSSSTAIILQNDFANPVPHSSTAPSIRSTMQPPKLHIDSMATLARYLGH